MWFRLDDKFHSHPKVLAAGNAAVGLYCRCGTWSADLGSDGRIPKATARHFGSAREIAALLRERLWLDDGDAYVMPDFLEFNPSASAVDERRGKRAAAGRAGGLATQANRRATGQANAQANGEQTASNVEPRPDPTRPDQSQVSTRRQTEVPEPWSSVVEDALERYAVHVTDQRGVKVRERGAYLEGVLAGARRERLDELAAYLEQRPDATAVELAAEVLDVPYPQGSPTPRREAWYVDPNCDCGDGWRSFESADGRPYVTPCPCRSDAPFPGTTADVIPIRRNA